MNIQNSFFNVLCDYRFVFDSRYDFNSRLEVGIKIWMKYGIDLSIKNKYNKTILDYALDIDNINHTNFYNMILENNMIDIKEPESD